VNRSTAVVAIQVSKLLDSESSFGLIWSSDIPLDYKVWLLRADTVERVKIGQLAAEVGTTTKTIRFYESIGLLDEPERTSSGYRDYGRSAVERLGFVKQAQATGLTLDEIGSILQIKDRGGRSCEHTRGLLASHLNAIDERIEELRRARIELRRMFDRAAALDPADCDDPNRCQVITETLSTDDENDLTFPSTRRRTFES